MRRFNIKNVLFILSLCVLTGAGECFKEQQPGQTMQADDQPQPLPPLEPPILQAPPPALYQPPEPTPPPADRVEEGESTTKKAHIDADLTHSATSNFTDLVIEGTLSQASFDGLVAVLKKPRVNNINLTVDMTNVDNCVQWSPGEDLCLLRPLLEDVVAMQLISLTVKAGNYASNYYDKRMRHYAYEGTLEAYIEAIPWSKVPDNFSVTLTNVETDTLDHWRKQEQVQPHFTVNVIDGKQASIVFTAPSPPAARESPAERVALSPLVEVHPGTAEFENELQAISQAHVSAVEVSGQLTRPQFELLKAALVARVGDPIRLSIDFTGIDDCANTWGRASRRFFGGGGDCLLGDAIRHVEKMHVSELVILNSVSKPANSLYGYYWIDACDYASCRDVIYNEGILHYLRMLNTEHRSKSFNAKLSFPGQSFAEPDFWRRIQVRNEFRRLKIQVSKEPFELVMQLPANAQNESALISPPNSNSASADSTAAKVTIGAGMDLVDGLSEISQAQNLKSVKIVRQLLDLEFESLKTTLKTRSGDPIELDIDFADLDNCYSSSKSNRCLLIQVLENLEQMRVSNLVISDSAFDPSMSKAVYHNVYKDVIYGYVIERELDKLIDAKRAHAFRTALTFHTSRSGFAEHWYWKQVAEGQPNLFKVISEEPFAFEVYLPAADERDSGVPY